jgi:hypothetical protein
VYLGRLQPDQVDILRGKLRIGVHSDVAVTDAEGEQRPLVSQAFCSALPVAYTGVPSAHWRPFASLVNAAVGRHSRALGFESKERSAADIFPLLSARRPPSAHERKSCGWPGESSLLQCPTRIATEIPSRFGYGDTELGSIAVVESALGVVALFLGGGWVAHSVLLAS